MRGNPQHVMIAMKRGTNTRTVHAETRSNTHLPPKRYGSVNLDVRGYSSKRHQGHTLWRVITGNNEEPQYLVKGFNTPVKKLSVRKLHTQLQRKHETSDKQGTATISEEHEHSGKDNQCTEISLMDSQKPQSAKKSRTTRVLWRGNQLLTGARQTKRWHEGCGETWIQQPKSTRSIRAGGN